MIDTINPSITASIGQNQPQPLDMFAKFAYTQNALLEAQKYRATQAAGQLYTQSMGPDGKPDVGKFATLLASHPETSVVAPDMLNRMAQQGMIDAETTNQQLAAQGTRAQRLGNVLLAAGKDPTVKGVGDLGSYLSQAESEGGIDPNGGRQKMIAWMADPKNGIGDKTDADLRQAVTNHGLALMQGSLGLQATSSNFSPDAFHDVNGNAIPGWTNPARQTAVPATGGAQNALSAGPSAGAPAAAAAAAQGGGPGGPTAAPPQQPAAPDQSQSPYGQPLLGAPGAMRQKQLQDYADYRTSVAGRASQTAGLVNQLNIAQRYMRAVDTGKFAEIKADLANGMRSAGFSPDIYNAVGNGDLASSQALMKQFMNGAIQSIANIIHTASAGTRLGQQETLLYMAKGAPSIEMTPQGINKVISSAKEIAHYSYLENEYVKAKANQPGYDPVNTINDWPTVYNNLVERAGAQ